jgi:flagellar hook protein FlgE
MSSQLGPITLSSAAIPPVATTSMTVAANLNANAVPPAVTPFDPNNAAASSNGSTSFQVYDSLGNAHTVNVYFCNTAPGQWTYHEVANGSEVSGGTPGKNVEIGSGQLSFDANGDLSNVTPTGGSVTFNGANAQTIAFNVGTPTSSGGTGRDGLTQNGGTGGASDVAVSAQSQNGYASGDLSGIQIGADGTVSGQYTNGQTLAVGQLAVASFQSNNGLSSVGQNLWAATQQSGSAALGTAGSGGRGAIQSGALEESNVDIATQFVDLIAHQQGYEANSKTITTVDQMLSTLQNMIS